MYTVERHEIYIDTSIMANRLHCFQCNFTDRAAALSHAKRFNDTREMPEQAFVRVFKHGEWLRVVV